MPQRGPLAFLSWTVRTGFLASLLSFVSCPPSRPSNPEIAQIIRRHKGLPVRVVVENIGPYNFRDKYYPVKAVVYYLEIPGHENYALYRNDFGEWAVSELE